MQGYGIGNCSNIHESTITIYTHGQGAAFALNALPARTGLLAPPQRAISQEAEMKVCHQAQRHKVDLTS